MSINPRVWTYGPDTSASILPSADVFDTLDALERIPFEVQCTILDPWYNRGVGGVMENYDKWLDRLVLKTASLSSHIFLWGFPEIVRTVLDHLPSGFYLAAWLTWYYKNCPSVIRGWRSAQFACLHIAREGASLYPEHFLNEAQLERLNNGKMRYVPGPPSVLEAPLNIGFVGKNEQTGHPAQKPLKVIEPLVLMSTRPGDVVLDPMCGSGTTGEACLRLGRNAILCDESQQWTEVSERRLTRVEAEIGNTGVCGDQGSLFAEVSPGSDRGILP